MSLIAIIEIAHPELGLTPTLRAVPEAEVRMLPHSGTDPETGRFAIFVEANPEAIEEFAQALADDHTVADAEVIARPADGAIYQVSHTADALLVSPTIVQAGGNVRDARSVGRQWRMHLQVPDREAVTTLWEYCEAEGISVRIQRLYRQEGWVTGEATDLTDAQRTALLTAYRHGYFDEPRETSLEELAEELGVSPTAVGGRIRRGVAALIETTVREE